MWQHDLEFATDTHKAAAKRALESLALQTDVRTICALFRRGRGHEVS
jgi:hypothetical protein